MPNASYFLLSLYKIFLTNLNFLCSLNIENKSFFKIKKIQYESNRNVFKLFSVYIYVSFGRLCL